MPSTLPGFLVLVGTVLFIGSLFKGSLSVGSISLPELTDKNRQIVRYTGMLFFVAGISLFVYLAYIGAPAWSTMISGR